VSHSPPTAAPPLDDIDEIVGYWHAANPRVDPTTKALALRLRRTAHLLERAMHEELAGEDIDTWEVETLLALHRTPTACTAGTLQRAAQVSSAAMTNRVARLEQRGWVRRDIDPSDRRQVLVTLTEAGTRRAEELVAAKIEGERRFFSGLDHDTLEQMNAALKKLLSTRSL